MVVVPAAAVAGAVVEVVEVVDVVEVVEVVEAVELLEEEDPPSADSEGCAPANGARRASIPAAAEDIPNVALSDHTTVRTSFLEAI